MAEILSLQQAAVQPHNIEAEQQVLGAILIDSDRVSEVAAGGGARLFYDPVHAEIFKKIAECERDGILATPVTLRVWAEAHEGVKMLGGATYMLNLAAGSVAGFMVRDYVQTLSDLAAKRDLIDAISDAQKSIDAGNEDAATIAARLEMAVGAVESAKGPSLVSMMAATTKAGEAIMAAYNGEDAGQVATGINALDHYISGLYPGEMCLLGGRPSMGKTAVAINIALNAARAGKRIAFCSLEMTPEAIALRCISEGMSNLGRAASYRDLRAGQLHELHFPALKKALSEIADLPMQFLPTEFKEIGALSAGVKKAKAKMGGLDMVVVDYVQLMRANQARGRYEIITEISTALKGMAMRLEVPVLALSQLSRKVEERDDKRPRMDDLRESGQLEQDADCILFCYRDEYYIEREKPADMDHLEAWQAELEAARNRLEIIVAKQRNGSIGTAHAFCNVAYNRIWEA